MSFDPSQCVGDCPFCTISTTFAATPPSAPIAFNADLVSPAAFVVLSTPLVMAFLDIMPLSPGHLLVTTRAHHEKVSDVTEEEARELGYWLPVLSAAAAQVVPHVHFHIIPRPALTPELRNKSFTMFGRGQRTDLDEEEAAELVEKLRQELARETGKPKI
ncbi:hypothetical protein VE04_07903 [Pseudogymnoascus sp. 24MN13]|nr:hypothetical protein VE04_07903 [Pseudogymnoascus sp. 24MN13]